MTFYNPSEPLSRVMMHKDHGVEACKGGHVRPSVRMLHLRNYRMDFCGIWLFLSDQYEGVSKSFRTESITKYTVTTMDTR